jgi:hypothetical protein
MFLKLYIFSFLNLPVATHGHTPSHVTISVWRKQIQASYRKQIQAAREGTLLRALPGITAGKTARAPRPPR